VDRLREPLPTRVEETSTLPTAYHDALDQGLAELGLTLSPGARTAIDGHVRLLLAWTSAINLTSIRDPADIALAHVVDSLSAVPLLRERGVDRFIDLGSGGGYPGLPLAAALPSARALLLEPIRKKTAFLAATIDAIGLSDTVEAAPVRAEALAADRRHRGRWPAVTARAVAGLAELIELACRSSSPVGSWSPETRRSRPEWLAAERALSALRWVARAIRRTIPARWALPRGGERRTLVPAAYPRDPAVRRRRTW
jgi:16S rRNA (guanine527-N7)-methyltransferase